jgi:putative glutamine amidotransferase
VKNIATWIRECDEAPFAKVFARYLEARLWNARTESVPWPEMHALLLTGGSDISLDFLRQPVPDPTLIQDPDPRRDAWEFEAIQKALDQKLPLFGICRGLQVLNVALGGTLHLDIPHHDSSKYDNVQELLYEDDALLRIPHVNSSHHQALDQLGLGLHVEARHAVDGVIEQARLVNYPFGLGVQYHPERDPLYHSLFDAFVESIPKGVK